MNLDRLKEDLIADEGLKLEIYLCNAEPPRRTVGIGHMLTPVDPEWLMDIGDTITRERCDELFAVDIETTIRDCERVYENWDSLPDEAQLICANMMYNLGQTRMSSFLKYILALNQSPPDIASAAVEMADSRWHEQLPNRSQRLIDRMNKLRGDA